MFDSLAELGLPTNYIDVLKRLYANQIGTVDGEADFVISRGVRQGDVLSPLLFNCALESVIRRWKLKLADHGWNLTSEASSERLTNVRYADDLMLFGKCLDETIEMINLLHAELSRSGFEMNAKKTKILTTDTNFFMMTSPYLVETTHGLSRLHGTGTCTNISAKCCRATLATEAN